MTFKQSFRDELGKGLSVTDAIRLALHDKRVSSFRDSIRQNRKAGKSARDSIKAWRDSTGAFLTGENERTERKAHPPLGAGCGCGCENCKGALK